MIINYMISRTASVLLAAVLLKSAPVHMKSNSEAVTGCVSGMPMAEAMTMTVTGRLARAPLRLCAHAVVIRCSYAHSPY